MDNNSKVTRRNSGPGLGKNILALRHATIEITYGVLTKNPHEPITYVPSTSFWSTEYNFDSMLGTQGKPNSKKRYLASSSSETLKYIPLEVPSKKQKIFLENESEDDYSENQGLKVNREFARRFEHNKKREELHRRMRQLSPEFKLVINSKQWKKSMAKLHFLHRE